MTSWRSATKRFISACRSSSVRWRKIALGNYLAKERNRRLYAPFVGDLRKEPRVETHPAEEETFSQAAVLYGRRSDKAWSMTDCLSFVIMKRDGLVEALTTDHHFEQAGFTILLK